MYNFYQVAIIRRYITKNPLLEANIKLKELTELLIKTDKESFTLFGFENIMKNTKIF